ncbi:MAG: PAS domain S-box protein [Nitrospirae bacterium]|nr:PAS domain S-box protein [Nitrospirota bacterium]
MTKHQRPKPGQEGADLSKNKTDNSLRTSAEKMLKKKNLMPFHEMSDGHANLLMHELQVHQIELELQNEELTRMRAELEATLGNYTSLYDFAPVGYFVFDASGVIRSVNLTGATMLGIERSLIIKKRFGSFVDEADLPKWNSHIINVQQNVEKQTCELKIKRDDGTSFYARLESIRVDSGDKVFVIRTAVSDVSESKQMEKALRKSEYLLQTIIDTEPQCVKMLDADANLIMMNKAGLKMIQVDSLDQVKGQCVRPLIVSEHWESFMNLTKRVFMGESGSLVFEITGFKGRHLWLETHAVPFRNEQNEIVALLSVTLNITARRQADEKIRNLLAEKDLILKEVHHRIKNNMNVIAGLLSLQANMLENQEAVAALNDSKSRVISMMALYDKLYRSECFLEVSFKGYATLLINEITANFANRKKVRIEIHIEDFIISAKLLSTVGIIINEIVTNAMKHAFSGRKDCLLSVSAALKNQYITLVIEDNGVGLPEFIDIHEPKGFGLQLLKMLTKQLGGSMKIEREQGTRFILKFKQQPQGE